MRLIDADDILPMMERKMDMQDLYLPIHFQEMVIDEMPTVDAVEVVRCENCRYSRPYMLGLYRCDRTDIALATGEDEYCSRGEREEYVSD